MMQAQEARAPRDEAGSPAGPSIAGRVGCVVIGRNEGERLVRCLQSVLAQIPDVVYVDSGSTDDSPERAQRMGARVIVLRSGPYTAARGRQAGIEELARLSPAIEYVQFIDGDCTLDPAWVARGVEFLDANPRAGGVFGRRREARFSESFFSRLVDVDWEMPQGRVHCHGGDALDRLAALRDIGGWSTDLIAGEDPDLGFRLGDKGWEIHCLPVEMTRHDIAISRFRPYWKRTVRSGHAYAEVYWRNRHGSGRRWLKTNLSILGYGLALPLLIAASGVWYWPAAVLLSLLLVRSWVKLILMCRRRGLAWGLSLSYATITQLCKTAQAIGVLKYIWSRLTGRRQRLMEYKGPHPAGS
jgi:glycosyltransferase involved in cell wall biosynthesis